MKTAPIALMNMPFGTLLQPSLALGQIKQQLAEAGMQASVHNMMFNLAERIGVGHYEIVARLRGDDVELGEWLFSTAAWGKQFGPTLEEFMERSGKEIQALDSLVADPAAWLTEVRNEVIPQFLDDMADALLESGELKVAGFSCLSFQTMASLALARKIKEKNPEIRTVFGGASFHRGMGEEFIQAVDWIDAVATGEADDEIVPLFEALLQGPDPVDLPGIHWRAGDMVLKGPDPHMVMPESLEKMPAPNFDEYFEECERLGLMKDVSFRERIFIPYEASRGCWWGEIKHCTYCGLNAEGMNFRTKSADRTIETLKELTNRYPTKRYIATDNIMPVEYYKTFLPRWAKEKPEGTTIFYEIRPHLTEEQMKALAEAGVMYTVPGVESLSTHMLKLFRKATRAIQNVYFLKLARIYGMYPLWNLLIRIPGEKPEDYLGMADLIPKVEHYMPPFGGPRDVEVHRFSPYFNQWPEYAEKVTPRSWYKDLYPEEKMDLDRVAYYFDVEWKDILPQEQREPAIQATWAWIDAWRNTDDLPRLSYQAKAEFEGGSLELYDSRQGRNRTIELDEVEGDVYRQLRGPIGLKSLTKKMSHVVADEVAMKAILDSFVEAELAIEEEGRYLGLALPDNAPEPPLAVRRNVLARVGQDAER